MADARDPNPSHPASQDNEGRQEHERLRRMTMTDNEFQIDPELMEGPASRTRVALFAMAILAVLAAVFYGLNTPANTPATTATQPRHDAAKTTGQAPASGSAVRDVTPSRSGGQADTAGTAPLQPAPAAGGRTR